MYEAFYGLTEKPFSILPDPEFIYWGRAHSMASAMLEYSILNQAGFTVITGEVGSGKTTLIQYLLRTVPEDIRVGVISNTSDQVDQLLQWVLLAFDQPYAADSTVAQFDQLQRFLRACYSAGQRCALIIDEAQNLGTVALEQLRMLSNINTGKHQLLQLILVGQPELKGLLQRPELRQFAQRISSDFHLRRLSLRETVAYIDHRMALAGQRTPLFTEAAIEAIHRVSEGTPRIINILCDTALVYGFSSGAREISKEIVDQVIEDKRNFGIFDTSGPRVTPIDSRQSS